MRNAGNDTDVYFEQHVPPQLRFATTPHLWRDELEDALLSVGQEHAARLGEINVPTLIMWGEHDAVFSREEQERLTATIADATLKVYSDTGHGVHWERSEEVVRDLEAFMKEVRPVR
jgi:non-heme chloroperoxidase